MVAKGEGIIRLDALGFKQSVEGVKKGFGDLDKSATNAMNKVKQKSNEAAAATKKVGDAASGTGSKMQNLSVQVIGLGQAVTGATAAWAGYNEQIVALNKQIIAQEQLTVSVTRAEEDLAVVIEEGALSIQEITRKTEDLNFMRRNQAIGLEEIATKEKTMETQLVTLGFTMVQTGFFGISTLSIVLSANQKAWIAAKFATLGFSKASLTAAFSMGTLRAAMTAVSTHPLMTIALVAAAAAMAAYEANVFGLRDTLSDLAGTELPTISESLTNLTGSVLPDASAQTEELTASLERSKNMLDGYEQKVGDTSEALDTFSNSADSATTAGSRLTGSSAASTWAKYWKDRLDEINKAESALSGFNGQVDRLKSAGFSPAVIEAAIQSGAGATIAAATGTGGRFDNRTLGAIAGLISTQLGLGFNRDINLATGGNFQRDLIEAILRGESFGKGSALLGTAASPFVSKSLQDLVGQGITPSATINQARGFGFLAEAGRITESPLENLAAFLGGGTTSLALEQTRARQVFNSAFIQNFGSGGGFAAGDNAGRNVRSGGSRNTKQEKLDRLRQSLSNADYQLALSLGLTTGRHGTSLSVQFISIAIATRKGRQAREAFERTGVKIPVLRLFTTSRKGNSGIVRAMNNRARKSFTINLAAAFAEANRRLAQRAATIGLISGAADLFNAQEVTALAELSGTGSFQDAFQDEFTARIFEANQGLLFFRRTESFADLSKAILLKPSGALNYSVARTLNDRLSFLGQDRLALVRA